MPQLEQNLLPVTVTALGSRGDKPTPSSRPQPSENGVSPFCLVVFLPAVIRRLYQWHSQILDEVPVSFSAKTLHELRCSPASLHPAVWDLGSRKPDSSLSSRVFGPKLVHKSMPLKKPHVTVMDNTCVKLICLVVRGLVYQRPCIQPFPTGGIGW